MLNLLINNLSSTERKRDYTPVSSFCVLVSVEVLPAEYHKRLLSLNLEMSTSYIGSWIKELT